MKIERKFKIADDSWKGYSRYHYMIRQGYLCTGPTSEIQVCIERHGSTNMERAYIVVTSSNDIMDPTKIDQTISLEKAEELMSLAKYKVSRIRHNILDNNGILWEVDKYLDDNQGLTIATAELPDKDDLINAPSWLGDEITSSTEYKNAYLAVHPINSKDIVPDLKTHITVNGLIEMCKHNNISLDTHIIIGNVDQWNYPMMYEFVPCVNKYPGTAEIALNILTDSQDEA